MTYTDNRTGDELFLSIYQDAMAYLHDDLNGEVLSREQHVRLIVDIVNICIRNGNRFILH